MNRALLPLLLLLTACYPIGDGIDPQITPTVQAAYLTSLPSPFPALSPQEDRERWGEEYFIAKNFARELDLYRSITACKRAEFLLPADRTERLEEIQYRTLFNYYLGNRYWEVIDTFHRSTLRHSSPAFPAYHDLLVILYESHQKSEEEERSLQILETLRRHDPITAEKLELSTALIRGDFTTLRKTPIPELAHLIDQYDLHKKSISKARLLNAILPGAGYLYVGQKQSAITAFLLNGLFIGAAIHFFHRGHICAGVITTSFEAGWYFGGIYGSGEAAKLYNERIYEKTMHPFMREKGLFPIFTLKYGF